MRKPIRILVADDHPLVLEGIRTTLRPYRHLKIIGVAQNGREAVEETLRLHPDILLLDINMPLMNGIEVVKSLRQSWPEVRIVMLTMYHSREYVMALIKEGVRGYVLKETSPSDLVRACEMVHRGDAFFSPAISRYLLEEVSSEKESETPLSRLTSRETEVLKLIALGHSNKEIAKKLHLGVRTVESHRGRVMQKLEIRTVAGLTRLALAEGLLK